MTKRLGFRNWMTTDLPLAEALWGNPEVSKYLGGTMSPKQIEARLFREIECQRLHGIQYWPIFELDGDAHVGCCGLRPRDLSHRIYELGYHIRREFWGKGMATEAARGVCDWARTNSFASGLFAGHHPLNLASKTVLEKLGFRFTHEEVYLPTEPLHPSYFLSLTSSDAAADSAPHCN